MPPHLPAADDTLPASLQRGCERLSELGVRYADIRVVDREQEMLQVRNEEVDSAWTTRDRGFGVRALVGDAWGYSASANVSDAEISRCVDEAVAIARTGAPAARRVVDLGGPSPQRGEWQTRVERDPFDQVSAAEKVEALVSLSRTLRRTPHVVVAKALAHCLRTTTHLCSTEGTLIRQRTVHTGGGIAATAERNGEVQQRTWPKHFEGNIVSGGWERWVGFALEREAPRVAEEAVALCTAPVCPTRDDATVILDPSILSLQLHESCGHPTELDRAFGEEVSLAGASFLTPDRLGAGYRYGSDLVTIYADATSEAGCGTFGWDDEGTPAHRTDLVSRGIFTGYLSSRESARRVGLPSAGSLRADSWRSVPIVRMINVNLEPGQGSFDDLIASTEDGVLISGSKSWSIDDLRLNFQFGCELAREIRGGKLGQLYRNPVYTGITPRFWRGCDAICGPEEWQMWGFLHCGKGDPIQTIHVGHGVAPARFRGVRIGTT